MNNFKLQEAFKEVFNKVMSMEIDWTKVFESNKWESNEYLAYRIYYLSPKPRILKVSLDDFYMHKF